MWRSNKLGSSVWAQSLTHEPARIQAVGDSTRWQHICIECPEHSISSHVMHRISESSSILGYFILRLLEMFRQEIRIVGSLEQAGFLHCFRQWSERFSTMRRCGCDCIHSCNSQRLKPLVPYRLWRVPQCTSPPLTDSLVRLVVWREVHRRA